MRGHGAGRRRRRPRHHRGHECADRGQDRARGHARDARLSRHPGDRPSDPLAALRRAPPEAGASRAPALERGDRRAPRRRRARAAAPRHGRGADGGALSQGRGRGGGGDLLPARVPEPRARTGGGDGGARGDARGVAVRVLGRVPGVPRVLAREHRRRERGRDADRVALRGCAGVSARCARRHRPLLRDAVERRGDDLRVRQGAARLHGRVGAGGRRHRGGRRGRTLRPSQRDVVRHGRDHRQGRPHPGRPAPALDRDGGRCPGRDAARRGDGAAGIPCARR